MSAQLEHGTGGLLIYRNALLIVTVLGGVKLEGLDRMRVTLKVEIPDSPRPPVRHNLDLYNDNQLGKLVRVIAARLEGMAEQPCGARRRLRLRRAMRGGDRRKPPQPHGCRTARAGYSGQPDPLHLSGWRPTHDHRNGLAPPGRHTSHGRGRAALKMHSPGQG